MQTTAWGKNKIINITTLAVSATLPKVRPLLPNSRWNQVRPILSHSLLWKKKMKRTFSQLSSHQPLWGPSLSSCARQRRDDSVCGGGHSSNFSPHRLSEEKPARSRSPGTRASADRLQGWAGAAAPGRLRRCKRNPPPPPPRAHSGGASHARAPEPQRAPHLCGSERARRGGREGAPPGGCGAICRQGQGAGTPDR